MNTRVLLLVLLFAFGGARLSCALDPARPISQYALMKWGASSLPGSSVRAIAEDDDGLLFGIKGYGLARFDGRRFVRYARALPPRPDDYIHFIHPARDGTQWVTSPHALVHLHAGGTRVYTERDGLPGSRVRWISEDTDGSLWLACESGLAHLEDHRIRALTTAHGLPESYLRIVLDDERGHLWIPTPLPRRA